ncbi:hypothetical protein AMJ47_01470 [Parcubacteria bacterium DG_72]|nr:MAG: hypothetical protein AMJ47_01470 [Parcubacteria bacterium DG_72]
MPKIKTFKDMHWQAIEMRWKGYSYQEIAGKLKISKDTVKSWFRRKNGLLREHYKDYAEDQYIKYYRNRSNKRQ